MGPRAFNKNFQMFVGPSCFLRAGEKVPVLDVNAVGTNPKDYAKLCIILFDWMFYSSN